MNLQELLARKDAFSHFRFGRARWPLRSGLSAPPRDLLRAGRGLTASGRCPSRPRRRTWAPLTDPSYSGGGAAAGRRNPATPARSGSGTPSPTPPRPCPRPRRLSGPRSFLRAKALTPERPLPLHPSPGPSGPPRAHQRPCAASFLTDRPVCSQLFQNLCTV